MLRGVLVIFTYIVSLIKDEYFEIIRLVYLRILIYFMVIYRVDLKEIYLENRILVVENFWLTFIGLFNIFIIIFLLMIILIVVWLSKIEEGALCNV